MNDYTQPVNITKGKPDIPLNSQHWSTVHNNVVGFSLLFIYCTLYLGSFFSRRREKRCPREQDKNKQHVKDIYTHMFSIHPSPSSFRCTLCCVSFTLHQRTHSNYAAINHCLNSFLPCRNFFLLLSASWKNKFQHKQSSKIDNLS